MATALASNTRQSTAAWTPRRVADELRTVLHRLRATYAGLLRELQAHRDAIRAADTSAISASVHRQEQFMAEVEHADRRRREIVAGACTVFADIATAARGGAGMITVTRVITPCPRAIARCC